MFARMIVVALLLAGGGVALASDVTNDLQQSRSGNATMQSSAAKEKSDQGDAQRSAATECACTRA